MYVWVGRQKKENTTHVTRVIIDWNWKHKDQKQHISSPSDLDLLGICQSIKKKGREKKIQTENWYSRAKITNSIRYLTLLIIFLQVFLIFLFFFERIFESWQTVFLEKLKNKPFLLSSKLAVAKVIKKEGKDF